MSKKFKELLIEKIKDLPIKKKAELLRKITIDGKDEAKRRKEWEKNQIEKYFISLLSNGIKNSCITSN